MLRSRLHRARNVYDVPSSTYLLFVDFTSLPTGALASLPGGLVLTRASSATVRTGTSTVVTSGITTDVARVGRRLDADAKSLVFEETRTNYFPYSEALSSASLSAGSGASYTDAQTDPAGGTTASRVQVSSGGYSRYFNAGAVTGTYIQSVWAKKGPGSGSYRALHGAAGSYAFIGPATAGADWARSDGSALTIVAGIVVVVPQDGEATGPGGAAARDSLLAFVQWEKGGGAFTSEYIPTSGASATRAGERLYHPTASSVVDAGRLGLEVRCRPKGARADYGAAIRLWTSGSDYAEIAVATGVMTISINGSTNTLDPITWSQYDTVDMWVVAGGGVATVVKYRVNNGAVTTLAVTAGSALGNVSTAGALDVACNSTANQLSAWIEHVGFCRSGRQPAWTL